MEELFPYRPRAVQDRLMDLIVSHLEEGRDAVVEAPTGSGKTAAVLAAVLSRAIPADLRVVYLTRTNAQQVQVVRELSRIAETRGRPIPYAPLQGRRHLCPLTETRQAFAEADAEELGVLCRDAQDVTARRHPRRPGDAGCVHFHRWLDDPGVLDGWIAEETPTAEELVDRARSRGVCPYEIVRDRIGHARVVAAPYIYLFEPGLRRNLLEWMGARLDELIVVVDEAHNLPGYARQLASQTLTVTTLERAHAEAEDHRDPVVLSDVAASELLELVRIEVEELANVHADDDAALLPPDAFSTALMTRFQTTDVRLQRAFDRLVEIGDAVRDQRRREGDVPRSHIRRAGAFLGSWFGPDAPGRARIVHGGPNPALERACLDPARTTDVLGDVHASVHVSGTLPGLDAYRQDVGLPPEVGAERLAGEPDPSSIPVAYTPDLTTRHDALAADPQLLDRIHATLVDVLQAAPASAMVAIPSFDLLDAFVDRGLDGDLVESPDLSQRSLHGQLEAFRSADRGRVLAVSGGRICEGIDLPGDQLGLVVQVGIPYPAPTARNRALKRYHDARSGRGFERAVHLPAARRLRQTLGRLLRGPDDEGRALILDGRAPRFEEELPGLEPTRDPAAFVRVDPAVPSVAGRGDRA